VCQIQFRTSTKFSSFLFPLQLFSHTRNRFWGFYKIRFSLQHGDLWSASLLPGVAFSLVERAGTHRVAAVPMPHPGHMVCLPQPLLAVRHLPAPFDHLPAPIDAAAACCHAAHAAPAPNPPQLAAHVRHSDQRYKQLSSSSSRLAPSPRP
jgi:hypothetical protein